jgi:hypothetical protein
MTPHPSTKHHQSKIFGGALFTGITHERRWLSLLLGSVLLHISVSYWGWGWVGLLGMMGWFHVWWHLKEAPIPQRWVGLPSSTRTHLPWLAGLLGAFVTQGLNYQWTRGLMPLDWLGMPSGMGWGLSALLWLVLVGYSSLQCAVGWGSYGIALRFLKHRMALPSNGVLSIVSWCLMWWWWTKSHTWHPLTMPWPAPPLALVDHTLGIQSLQAWREVAHTWHLSSTQYTEGLMLGMACSSALGYLAIRGLLQYINKPLQQAVEKASHRQTCTWQHGGLGLLVVIGLGYGYYETLTHAKPTLSTAWEVKGWHITPYVYPAPIETLRHPHQAKEASSQYHPNVLLAQKTDSKQNTVPLGRLWVFPEEGAFASPLYLTLRQHQLSPHISTHDLTFQAWQKACLASTQHKKPFALLSGAYGIITGVQATPEHHNIAFLQTTLPAIQTKVQLKAPFYHSTRFQASSFQWVSKRYLVPFGETWVGLTRNQAVALGDNLLKGLASIGMPIPKGFSCNRFFPLSFTPRSTPAIPSFLLPNLSHPSKTPLLLKPLICFEMLHPQVFKTLWDLKQASHTTSSSLDFDAVVNLSNLGWFHEQTVMQTQFLKHTYWMSYSLKTPVIMSHNDGISGIVIPEIKR